MPRRAYAPLVVIVALVAALLVLALMLTHASVPATRGAPTPPVAGAPPPPPPPPAAIDAEDLSYDQARLSNAAVPFAPGPVPPAPPFRFPGGAADRAAAEACLTAALLYEASDDPPGERAVAQLVLNRLRHPSYPKSVCGVIFQGSQRATGCQFTFTCDGALARTPDPRAWARAREIARAALDGHVEKAVGTVTHDHTDWIVPYWRDSLVKVAQVHTQIYYRFPGKWGRPSALTGRWQGPEIADPRLFRLAPDLPLPGLPAMEEDVAAASAPRQSLTIAGVPPGTLKGSIVRLQNEEAAQYVLQLKGSPAAWGTVGYAICGPREDCLVLGWTDERDTPRALPVLPGAMRSLVFMYRKSSVFGGAQPLWDCTRYPRAVRAECLPRTAGFR